MISILKKTVGFVTLLALAGGCRAPETNDAIVVVASFFPIAEVASDLVTDDNVHVVNITPPGLEPHDVELTTQNLDELLDASLVLYIGGGFQPAIDDAVSRADGDVVDLSDGADDPHIWLDPVAWTTAVGKIADAIKSLGGGGAAELYATVARELADLDESFDAGLADCERDLVVTAHDA
ncbi:MAG: metal ABC transporter substrate-binding protein, partial [Actinomycetota bacterium]